MTKTTERRGSCLCGAVRVTAVTESNEIGACHCSMCRTWGSGPLFAADCEGNVSFEGTEHIETFGSSEWAERGFCRICGTHLFYRLKLDGTYSVPVGVLGDGGKWKFAAQIFIDEKPAYYSFAEKTANLTGAQVFARYTGE